MEVEASGSPIAHGMAKGSLVPGCRLHKIDRILRPTRPSCIWPVASDLGCNGGVDSGLSHAPVDLCASCHCTIDSLGDG